MKTFRAELKEFLADPRRKELYEAEKELLEVSLRLQESRRKRGLSQRQLARSAHLTQQQVSKVENGVNCNILTYLRASRASGARVNVVLPRRHCRKHMTSA